MDVGTFQAQFPEFRGTSPTLIKATLARAARWVSPKVWRDRTDDGVAYLTAHWLAQIPSGTTTKLNAVKTTVYGEEFERMQRAIVGGFPGGGTWR